ncbi:MAG: D-alanine--D-alanine ligase [Alicyclobacillus sp.]|nr:D-alanine--D-alanine ligase [Alicyclobacillus sp.]
MDGRIRVGVVFGGRSGEHEVSVQSARSILSALNREKYLPVPIAIDKRGIWHTGAQALAMLGPEAGRDLAAGGESEDEARTAIFQQDGPAVPGDNRSLPGILPVPEGAGLQLGALLRRIDVVFPVLHGSYGEDGTVQGLFELLDVPYVGAGVLASAVGMDKVFMKRAFAAAGLPQVAYTYCTRRQLELAPVDVVADVEAKLRYPVFVKPANLGSSVGISKAKDREGLRRALREAARYDRKVIVEQGLDVREIEVAVLGNDEPEASVPGEIIPAGEFYDYRAKYVSGESELIIPARVDDSLADTFRALAVRAFQAVDAAGMARVDFFLERGTGRILVNEINTIPGFTRFSMYPKLWEASGIAYSVLLDRLIQLALERFEEKRRTVTDYTV